MENKKQNSNLPLAIIGLVLLAALAGGWWFYSSSKTPPVKSSDANKSGASNPAEIYAKAAPGANPPNSLGAPNAAVTLEEFADFQCPTCAATHPIVKELRASYGDRLRVIFREFPLNNPTHDKAYNAAVAAEAAGLQGKFWEMQNLLFSNQEVWSKSPDYRKTFEEYAQRIGLDEAKFTNDMAGLPAKNRVDKDLERGRSLNLKSTPTFYINGKQVSPDALTVEGMRQIINAELQKQQGGNSQLPITPAAQNQPGNQSGNQNK